LTLVKLDEIAAEVRGSPVYALALHDARLFAEPWC